jgi:hypothetical protein
MNAAAVFEPAGDFQTRVIGAERHRGDPDVDRFGDGKDRTREQDQGHKHEFQPGPREKTAIKAPTHFGPF